jgi:hypothetical protein
VNKVAHLLGANGGVSVHVFSAGIDRDNPVEHARLRITIELDEDFALAHER